MVDRQLKGQAHAGDPAVTSGSRHDCVPSHRGMISVATNIGVMALLVTTLVISTATHAQQVIRTASDWTGQLERPAPGEDEMPVPPRVCLSEQMEYNSNLYRLNSAVAHDPAALQQRLGPDASRVDRILRTSACANQPWQWGQQDFSVSGILTDNRYTNNTVLNHASGAGALLWNWRMADGWYGQLGGRYKHVLANFLNDRPIAKDLVSSQQYVAQLNHDFGTYVIATVGGTRTDIAHGNPDREVDDYRNTTGYTSLIIRNQTDNQIKLAAQRTRATYPQPAMINDLPFDRDYEERKATIGFRYGMGSKTVLTANVGQMKHDYRTTDNSDYSGGIWNAALNWQSSTRSQLQVQTWKTVDAYFDAEADHYISRGTSLMANWSPRSKLQLSGMFSWERQEYLNNSLTVIANAPRTDNVRTAGLGAIYSPLEYFDIDLDYRYEQHDSDRPYLGFNTQVVSLRLRVKLPGMAP